LPTGLSLSSAGVISGTPTETETASFTVSVVSAGDTDSAVLSITVVTVGENEIPFGGTLTELSGDNDYSTWTVEVPTGASSLVVDISGGSGNPYLYVARGSSVGEGSGTYDCRGQGLPSRCVFDNPAPGTWSIMIKDETYSGGYSGVSLTVTGTPWVSVTSGGMHASLGDGTQALPFYYPTPVAGALGVTLVDKVSLVMFLADPITVSYWFGRS
jgi:hypothetical protein